MNVLGIVAEYNPFHNGHLHHLEASIASSNADCTVVVMSGNFAQRGEPAIVNKWARTEIALFYGADLVIELPCVYAMASAEYFAYGAVKLLDSLDAVNTLCFGSEAGTIENLSIVSEILLNEPDEYKSALKTHLSKGNSFPAARQAAMSQYFLSNNYSDDLSLVLNSPNNILGIEYLKALKRLNSTITPKTFKRKGNKYNSTELSGKLSSATSIRKAIFENGWPCARKAISSVVPAQTLHVLDKEFDCGRFPVFPSHFSDLIISRLRSMSVEEIKLLPYMEDGLEYRLKNAAAASGTYKELIDTICTRRYPATRIQRILFSILTGLKQNQFDVFNNAGGPAYIRILGFSSTGRLLLSKIGDGSSLPIITKTADYKKSKLPCMSDMLQIESDATDQYVLAYKNHSQRKSGNEYTQNVITPYFFST